MKLPENIKKQICEYLTLEFGESIGDPSSIKISDLKYEGEHVIDGVLMACWSFPSINKDTWATVEADADSYTIGMNPNPFFSEETTYEYVWIEIWEKEGRTVKVPLESNIEGLVYFENAYNIKFKSGSELSVYVEIITSSTPVEYRVLITEGDRDVSVCGDTKGLVDYNIDEVTGVKIAIGGENWF